jgi:hypothetical protein
MVLRADAAGAMLTTPVGVVEGLGHGREMLAGHLVFHDQLRDELRSEGASTATFSNPPAANASSAL